MYESYVRSLGIQINEPADGGNCTKTHFLLSRDPFRIAWSMVSVIRNTAVWNDRFLSLCFHPACVWRFRFQLRQSVFARTHSCVQFACTYALECLVNSTYAKRRCVRNWETVLTQLTECLLRNWATEKKKRPNRGESSRVVSFRFVSLAVRGALAPEMDMNSLFFSVR